MCMAVCMRSSCVGQIVVPNLGLPESSKVMLGELRWSFTGGLCELSVHELVVTTGILWSLFRDCMWVGGVLVRFE